MPSREERRKRLRARIAAAKKLNAKLQEEYRTRMITFLSTALGVVAALFWQTAITDTIKSFIPVTGAWFYEIGVAALVTLVAVTAIIVISDLSGKKKK